MKTTFFILLIGSICGAFLPLFGAETPPAPTGAIANADQRNTPITVDLIIDGSQALSNVLNKLNSSLSESLVDEILQNGDRLTIWSAAQTARILYSETIKTANDKNEIKKILKNLPAQGDSADFSGALLKISAGKPDKGIHFIMLANASYNTLSPALLGSAASLLRYSRVEEHSGWRMLIIAPDINERVRQAATGYLSGI